MYYKRARVLLSTRKFIFVKQITNVIDKKIANIVNYLGRPFFKIMEDMLQFILIILGFFLRAIELFIFGFLKRLFLGGNMLIEIICFVSNKMFKNNKIFHIFRLHEDAKPKENCRNSKEND
jgi:hypothetical protein